MLFEKYHLEIGRMEDVYQYTSYTPVEDVIRTACRKNTELSPDSADRILEELESELGRIRKE